MAFSKGRATHRVGAAIAHLCERGVISRRFRPAAARDQQPGPRRRPIDRSAIDHQKQWSTGRQGLPPGGFALRPKPGPGPASSAER